jgi:Sec-independent protein secretion pathway component TatC
MSEPHQTGTTRAAAYFVLAVAAAFGSPSPDVFTMLLFFLGGVALFEVGFLIYRRRQLR